MKMVFVSCILFVFSVSRISLMKKPFISIFRKNILPVPYVGTLRNSDSMRTIKSWKLISKCHIISVMMKNVRRKGLWPLKLILKKNFICKSAIFTGLNIIAKEKKRYSSGKKEGKIKLILIPQQVSMPIPKNNLLPDMEIKVNHYYCCIIIIIIIFKYYY